MCVKFVVFCVLLLCFIIELDALNAGDEGVCVIRLSSVKRRRVMVTVSRPCGRRRCILRTPKIQSQTVWNNRTICCQGWQHNSELDTCTPICIGCLNGRCTGPNICSCDPPLYFDEELNNCVTPHCEQPCFNAKCVRNNTCECDPNTRTYNETHCAFCGDNYLINSDLTCTPICEYTCINAECTGPNICSCLEGYIRVNSTACEPHCEDCNNGYCVTPNTCRCLPGYKEANGTCIPKCDGCQNGNCIGPNICACHEGYTNVDGECRAICDEICVNGYCSVPNICSCNEGYEKTENESICLKICRPECGGVCDIDGYCRPEDCINGTISTERRRPYRKNPGDNLVCCKGWKYENDSCKPLCRFGCVNGTCVEPNVCKCDPPLILSKNECVPPSCDPPCVNGDCVDTNICKCHKDFQLYNETLCIRVCPEGFINDPVECKPVCEKPCVNAICTDPNNCTCLPGYASMNDTYCAPICNTKCTNAECSAPDTCTCLPGYERLDELHCKPLCDTNRRNAICVGPNTWACLEGYVMEKGVCSPVCDSPCASGWCAEPNKCTCFDGYHPDPINIFNCLPSCAPDCVNASCVSPNTCQCNPGYEPIDGSKTNCKPICKECVNGDCISPNNCKCHDGYKNIGGRCYPECTRRLMKGETESCVNGYCSAPNNCTCLEGYLKNSTYECYKPCKGVCENGDCDSHGNCLCARGFRLQEGTCVPVDPKDCKLCGVNCTEGDCWCPDGTICSVPPAAPEEIASTTSLAGLELTWMLGGALGILLIVLVLVVIQRMWSKRKQYEAKASNDAGTYGSVVYSHTVQGTLIKKPTDPELPEGFYAEVSRDQEEPTANDQLLEPRAMQEDEQL